jgi:hypothetical protein
MSPFFGNFFHEILPTLVTLSVSGVFTNLLTIILKAVGPYLHKVNLKRQIHFSN